MKIHFFGAAGGVTGSKHLVSVGGKKILLDCGLFQGHRKKCEELNRNFPFDATQIDAVVLTHAHIDHSGLLPVLLKNGFDGNIFCTPPTADLLEPMLLDSAHIQESDARYYMQKKHRRKAIHPIEPLYTSDDARATLDTIVAKARGERFEIFPDIFVTFLHAGHVLGSAQVLLEGDGKTLAFTGDYGRPDRKIIQDPDRIFQADAIITETTYGGRRHPKHEETREQLGHIIRETAEAGGKVIIPSFALERSQEILYDLHLLYDQHKVPDIPVFVDSPLTTKFTHVFEKHREILDDEVHEFFLNKGKTPFSFARLKHTKSAQESMALNSFHGPCIILSASGMCEGGRIRHHLRHNIGDHRNTILIVGYQAKHTLGRRLVEKRSVVKIFDEMHAVRARLEILNGYSGHGDRDDLLNNIRGIKNLKKAFLVHGDDDARVDFETALRAENADLKIFRPQPHEVFEV